MVLIIMIIYVLILSWKNEIYDVKNYLRIIV